MTEVNLEHIDFAKRGLFVLLCVIVRSIKIVS